MNLDDRVTSLEQQTNTLRNIATQQMLHNRETDEHLTMLLGLAKGQESDIRAMQTDMSTMKERMTVVQTDINTIKTDLGVVNDRLSRVETRLDGIDQRLETIITLLSGTQPEAHEP